MPNEVNWRTDIVTAFSGLLDTAYLAFEDEPSVENAVYILEGFGRRFCRLPDRSTQSPARLSRHCDFRWQGPETPRFHLGRYTGFSRCWAR